MSIRFDPSWNSVVIICDQCPHWRAVRLDQLAAYRAGEAHAMDVHDVEPARAVEPRRLWEKRRAVKP